MGKNPAFQFYPSDWSRDTAMLSLDVKGAWIDILCAMWWSQERGVISGTPSDFARMLRISRARFSQILDRLQAQKICECDVQNGRVTLTSRRMVREEEERKNAHLRFERHQERQKLNGNKTEIKRELNGNITPLSSSSTSKKENTMEGTPFFTCAYFTVSVERAKKLMSTYCLSDQSLATNLRRMELWLDDNPGRRKKDYARFIKNWLEREQQRHERSTVSQSTVNGDIERLLSNVRRQRAETTATGEPHYRAAVRGRRTELAVIDEGAGAVCPAADKRSATEGDSGGATPNEEVSNLKA